MNNRIDFLIFIVVFTSFMAGCGDDDISTTVSVEMQRAEDSIAISEFINDKNFDPAALDTTASGVIYTVLEAGTGEEIEYNDIVDIFLTMKLPNDTLLLSNVDTVLQKYGRFDSTAVYNPLVISHTQSGWALSPPENNFLRLQGFIGVREGITALLNELNVGGQGIFITPSIASLQSRLSVSGYPYREVFVVYVYPTRVR